MANVTDEQLLSDDPLLIIAGVILALPAAFKLTVIGWQTAVGAV